MSPRANLDRFAARLRDFLHRSSTASRQAGQGTAALFSEDTPGGPEFDELALELFQLQFDLNLPYRKICEVRKVSPGRVRHWAEIPAVPTSAFKELELSCLPPDERTLVFHSSGTTGQTPSRHFHSAESLAVYESSLASWFGEKVLGMGPGSRVSHESARLRIISLTPNRASAPRSSLVHMFDMIVRQFGSERSCFVGEVAKDGVWRLNLDVASGVLRSGAGAGEPMLLLGTAFSFVHLLDHLSALNLRFRLPPASRVLETGGYKGRSRTLPKAELHSLISKTLGVPRTQIVCEYGMSELSSQAYDGARAVPARSGSERFEEPGEPASLAGGASPLRAGDGSRSSSRLSTLDPRPFWFPPWARAQVVSPETGREVEEGQTGLLRVFDLANVYSVMAIQTEDLAVRHGAGFELLGRAALAEPRGCSLMAVASE